MTVISDYQSRARQTVAVAPELGLGVVANGENYPFVVLPNGEVSSCTIPAATTAPTLSETTGGSVDASKPSLNSYYGYVYVYACKKKFPRVLNEIAINGRLWPRGNPSAYAKILTSAATVSIKSCTITITGPRSTDARVDKVWIFRTVAFAATRLKDINAAMRAGLFFYVGQVANPSSGDWTFTNNTIDDGVDQVEYDNYGPPNFRYVKYIEPYFWGYGNDAKVYTVDIDADGDVTFTDDIFDGTNFSRATLQGVQTGGYDGQGTFWFGYTGVNSGILYTDRDGDTTLETPATDITPGTYTMTLQHPPTTIYRSKANNPFAWGWTQVIGQSVIPQQFAVNVRGDRGTAIAQVPNQPFLKVDAEGPTGSFIFSLRAAADAVEFKRSMRILSETYSTSSHFSQFEARLANGYNVLWSLDAKNHCIVQSDGQQLVPLPNPFRDTLRDLTTNPTIREDFFGLYAPYSELNCLWIQDSAGKKICLHQHAPSGVWGMTMDFDLAAVCTSFNTTTLQEKLVGITTTGLISTVLDFATYANCTPSAGTTSGTVSSGTSTTLTISPSTFDTGALKVGTWVGFWVSDSRSIQYGRLTSFTTSTLTVDTVIRADGSVTTTFSPAPASGDLFRIGLIDCVWSKFIDGKVPTIDKSMKELWLEIEGAVPVATLQLEETATESSMTLSQSQYQNSALSAMWYCKNPPSVLAKSMFLHLVQRDSALFALESLTAHINPVQ